MTDVDQDDIEKQELSSPDVCQRIKTIDGQGLIETQESSGFSECRQSVVDQTNQKRKRKKSIAEKGNKIVQSTKPLKIRHRRKSAADNLNLKTPNPKTSHTDQRRRSITCFGELNARSSEPPDTRQRRKSVACYGELDAHVPKPPETYPRRKSVIDQRESSKLSRVRNRRNSLRGQGELDTSVHQTSNSLQRKISVVGHKESDNETSHLPITYQRRQTEFKYEEIKPETGRSEKIDMLDSVGERSKPVKSNIQRPTPPIAGEMNNSAMNKKENGILNYTENSSECQGTNTLKDTEEKNQPLLNSAMGIPSENNNGIQSARTFQERFPIDSDKNESKSQISPQSEIVFLSEQLHEKLKTTDNSNITGLPLSMPLGSLKTIEKCYNNKEATISSSMSPGFRRKTNASYDFEMMTSLQLSPVLRQRKIDNCGPRSPFSPTLLTRRLFAANEAMNQKSSFSPKSLRRMQREDLNAGRRMGSPVNFGETGHFPRIDEQYTNDNSGFENGTQNIGSGEFNGRWQHTNESLERHSPLLSPSFRVRRPSLTLASQGQDNSAEVPCEPHALCQRKKSIDEISMVSLCTDTSQKQHRKRSFTQREVREILAKSGRRTSLPVIGHMDPFVVLQGRVFGIKQTETIHPQRERRGSLPPTDLQLPGNPLGGSSRRERRCSLPPTHLQMVEDKIGTDLTVRDRGPNFSNDCQSAVKSIDNKSLPYKEKSRRRISLPSIGQADPFVVLQRQNIHTNQVSGGTLPPPHLQFIDQLGTTNSNLARREFCDLTKLQSTENRMGFYCTTTGDKIGDQSLQERKSSVSSIGTVPFKNQMTRKERRKSLPPTYLDSARDLIGVEGSKQESHSSTINPGQNKHLGTHPRWDETGCMPPAHLLPVRNKENDCQIRKRRVSLPATSLQQTEGLENFLRQENREEESISMYSIRKRRRSLSNFASVENLYISDTNNALLTRKRQTQDRQTLGIENSLPQSFCHLIPREFLGIPSCERRQENVCDFRSNLCLQRRHVKPCSDKINAHNLQEASASFENTGEECHVGDEKDDLVRPATSPSPVVSDIGDDNVDPIIPCQSSISDETLLPPRTPEPDILKEFNLKKDDSQAEGKDSYQPRYCWCTRCQMMYQMHKDNDNRLEVWGKYPCFKF